MHIGTGKYEGKEIKDAQTAGPLSAHALKIKEEIFMIIGTRVMEASVLSINDPIGMYGVEALSRGAAVSLFVNEDKKEADLVSENLKIVGVEPKGLVLNEKANKFLNEHNGSQFMTGKYDVIFFDVRTKEEISLVETVLEKQTAKGITVVFFPNNTEFVLPNELEGYEFVETREFDDKRVAIILKVNP